MNYKHVAILLVLGSAGVAIAWDIVLAFMGKLYGNSWCQAFRDINKASDGLLLFVTVAVLVHIACLQWFPVEWRHP